MKRVMTIAGYTWAAACVAVVLITFFGHPYLTARFASATGITVSPRYTGGEILRTVDHGAYRTRIRRPVFDGLFGERRDGFIQIEWQPVTALPAVIDEAIDLTGAGQAAFTVRLDTVAGVGTLTPRHPAVVALETLVRVKEGWVARITLHKAPGAPPLLGH